MYLLCIIISRGNAYKVYLIYNLLITFNAFEEKNMKYV